ncbi:MAG: sugar phosphate isomerase/epimerase [Pedosphaera sp.]|nr:sugar phosphate isomerase/epimerase [Pedosphaera sp.]
MNNLLLRRDFLKISASAAIGAAMIPGTVHAADSGKKRPNIHKGIMWSTVGAKGSVMEKFKICKEAGFEGIEAMSHMNQEEVLAARDATGLKVPSVCCATHWNETLTHPNPGTRERGLEGLQHSLKDAAKYGARSVLLVPGVVNKQVSYADAYSRSQEQIRKALPLAAELKVKIAIENVWNNFLLSPMEAARYIDDFQSPWVGWHFDIGNVIHYGWPEQWARILGKRIVTLHIKEFSRKQADAQGRGKGFAIEFLKGDNDWPAVMKAIDEIGFDGWGIAEQGGGDSLEGLTKLSTEMDQIFAS